MKVVGVRTGQDNFMVNRKMAEDREERFSLQVKQEYEELEKLFPTEKKAAEKQQDVRTAMEKLGGASANGEIVQKGDKLKQLHSGGKKAPYSLMADANNNITYNGVTFQCDDAHQCLSLGDISDRDNVLTVPLSGGGCLMVNRDNLDGLASAIGMFSPEDARRIMDAIAQDAKIQKAQAEIDDTVNGLGEEHPSTKSSDD